MTLNPNQPVQPDRERDPRAPEVHELPPLYPTGIPDDHQQDDTRFIQDRIAAQPSQPEKKSGVPSWAIVTAPLAVIAIGGAYLMGKGGEEKNPLAQTPPTASATPLESYSEQPLLQPEFTPEQCGSSIADVEAPVSVVECHDFIYQSPGDQQKILKLKNMPLSEFAKQPFADQYFYGNYLLQNRSGYAQKDLNTFLTNNGAGEYVVGEYADTLGEKPDKNVLDQINLKLASLKNMRITDTSGKIVVDKENAMKAISGIATPGSKPYNDLLSTVQNNPNTAILPLSQDPQGRIIFANTMMEGMSESKVVIEKTEVPQYTFITGALYGPTFGSRKYGEEVYPKISVAKVNPVDQKGQETTDYLLTDVR